jgi:hypothetical protein
MSHVRAPGAQGRMLERLERRGYQMVPLRRADRESPWYGDCPRCRAFGALHVEPDGSWCTTCGCRLRGHELELDAIVGGSPYRR